MKSSICTENEETLPYLLITAHGLVVTRFENNSSGNLRSLSGMRPYYTHNYSNINPILKWYLKATLTSKEYKDFSLLSALTSPDTTILLRDNEEPHTFESLAETLGFSLKKTKGLVHRFVKKRLVAIVPNPDSDNKDQMIQLYPNPLGIPIADSQELEETRIPLELDLV
jgi:hypothetical protein